MCVERSVVAPALKRLIGLLRAVAEPTRARLIKSLLGRELCVCELVDALQIPQYKVSRQLAILRRAGLVTDRRDGLWIYYSVPVRAKLDPVIKDVLKLVEAHVEDDRAIAADLARLEHRLALRVDGKCVVGSTG